MVAKKERDINYLAGFSGGLLKKNRGRTLEVFSERK